VNAPNRPSRRLASIAAAAEYLATSQRTVRRMIASGDLTGYRIGSRLLRVDLNEVDAKLRAIPSAAGGPDAAA